MKDKLIERWTDSSVHETTVTKIEEFESKYQKFGVYNNKEFGNFFTLDGTNQMSERYEHIYHEMIVHPSFLINPEIKKVLIIGGGDGGTAREVLRYESVDSVVMVELDQKVIDVARKYFPTTSVSFDHKKFKLVIDDGINFVKQSKDDSYDLIIVDSTDMVEGDASKSLFTTDFYKNTSRILTKNGIVIAQAGNILFKNYFIEFKQCLSNVSKTFPLTDIYQYITPDYPGFLYYFVIGLKSSAININDIIYRSKWENNFNLKHFNKQLFMGSLQKSNELIKIVKDIKGE